jgi:hypothetical protein
MKRIFFAILILLLIPAFLYSEENGHTLQITINPMMDLDYKTKNEIYEIRKQVALQYPGLVKKDYTPSSEVFGQIEDGKPWWGMVGHSYFGPGEKSIVGPSEESRFIVNPCLLIGLSDINAYIVHDKSLTVEGIYPEPINLSWSANCLFAKVKYDVSSFWQKAKRYRYKSAETHELELVAYNARDLGFNYLYLVPEKSENVISFSPSTTPVFIKQFIHCGGSCGYPGGCNNMSPDQPELRIKVDNVPAAAYIKLWRNNPQDVNQPADMVFVIDMI